jgi:hypothetical protein
MMQRHTPEGLQRLSAAMKAQHADEWFIAALNRARPRGEAHSRAKLSSAQVREVRASAESASALALRFGVSKSAIACIRSGRNWRHV